MEETYNQTRLYLKFVGSFSGVLTHKVDLNNLTKQFLFQKTTKKLVKPRLTLKRTWNYFT